MNNRIENIDYIICPICKQKLKRIHPKGHLLKHNLTTEEFLKLYPNQKLTCKNLKNKISEGNKGKKLSLKHRLIISKSIKKAWKIKEFKEKQKLNQRRTGMKNSNESNIKRSISLKNKNKSLEHCKNISKGKKGKQFLEEHKKNLRIAFAKRIQEFGGGPNYTPEAIPYFQEFDKINNTHGIYRDNKINQKEFLILGLGYFPDYINFDLKLIIECDDPGHFDRLGNQLQQHVKRQNKIQELFPEFTFLRFKTNEMHKILEIKIEKNIKKIIPIWEFVNK